MTEPIDVAARVNETTIDALLAGFGVANQAVAEALVAHGHRVVATDDQPDSSVVAAATTGGIELLVAPGDDDVRAHLDRVDVVFPTPGLPEWHPVLAAARERGVAVAGELDLARAWDDRPLVGVTGTNGKTTVVELCVAALRRSGVEATAAGNTELPLVSALSDPEIEVFVVEASSFRLGHAQRVSPRVGTWINFAPDHLDVHRDLASYERAKAAIWRHIDDGTAVANQADPVVMRNLPDRGTVVTFGGSEADWRVDHGRVCGPAGELMAVEELWRHMPHDLEDALAAAATASSAGATAEAIAAACHGHRLAAHRVQLVGEVDGVSFYDDSKATTPHATVAALRGFDRTVLIAGGRNKGISLTGLRDAADHVQAVVAIGEAADEVATVFEGRGDVRHASDMDDAVDQALAAATDATVETVLLSPACASFDWYRDYAERGDDFARAVRKRSERSGAGRMVER